MDGVCVCFLWDKKLTLVSTQVIVQVPRLSPVTNGLDSLEGLQVLGLSLSPLISTTVEHGQKCCCDGFLRAYVIHLTRVATPS